VGAWEGQELPVSADLVAVIVFEADLHPPPGPILIRIAHISVRACRAAIAVGGFLVAARSPILPNGSLILVHHAAALALTHAAAVTLLHPPVATELDLVAAVSTLLS
jgi:hypothetical protein